MKTVADYIRTIPDFPEPGIMFRDITTVIQDADGLQLAVDEMAKLLDGLDFDIIAGAESRGFIFGVPLAYNLHKPFVPIRKAGKLPPPVFAESYDLEYGSASVEVEQNAIHPGERVLIVDDLIATGGTARAGADLIKKAGGIVAGFSFLMELDGLDGCSRLSEAPISTLIAMPA